MKNVLSVIILLTINSYLSAQTPDSMKAIREFLHVCNAYKQVPLHLKMEFCTSDNIDISEGINSTTTGEFFILPDRSYIRFGEMEQIVNDSMALIVSDQLKRMIVYPNARAVVAQMKSRMGLKTNDSSLINFFKRYTSDLPTVENGVGTIILNGRTQLMGTTVPNETIEIEYDVKSMMPKRITEVKRSLWPLSDIKKSVSEAELKRDEFVTVNGNVKFVIKKRSSSYFYKEIDHSLKDVPVIIADRIKQDSGGEYRPVKSYGGYALTENL